MNLPYRRKYWKNYLNCVYGLKKQNGFTFDEEQMLKKMLRPIEIGNNFWICSNIFMCGGVKIWDGAVVYAGAIVTKDVPPYAIVDGVPAKIIKYCYDKITINKLLNIKWWNKPIDELKNNWLTMTDLNSFINLYI